MEKVVLLISKLIKQEVQLYNEFMLCISEKIHDCLENYCRINSINFTNTIPHSLNLPLEVMEIVFNCVKQKQISTLAEKIKEDGSIKHLFNEIYNEIRNQSYDPIDLEFINSSTRINTLDYNIVAYCSTNIPTNVDFMLLTSKDSHIFFEGDVLVSLNCLDFKFF